MTERLGRWINRWGLWVISMLISLAFAGLDGRYLRSYMFAGWLGDVMAYTGNFLIDISSEFLVYEWTRHQRDTITGAARNRKRALSWGLLIGAGGLLYFALIFSYRQAVLLKPSEPDLYRWSVAAFAQFALLWLGWANALRDFPAKSAKSERAPRLKVATIADWREIYREMNGNRAGLDADRVNEILLSHGFRAKPDSTARGWANEARG
jgi:hypothetical protein